MLSFNRLRDWIESHEKTIGLIKWCPSILVEDGGVKDIQMLPGIDVPEIGSNHVLEQFF